MTEKRVSWDTSLVDRRQALGTIGSAVTVGLAGCTGLLGKSKLEKQLETAREATADYEDPKAALQDGFKIGGPYVPGMGWHFSHPERLADAAENGLSIDTPPILTYVEGEDGLTLGSVEYAAPAPTISEDPDLFADENADATENWHTHEAATHVFATGDGSAQNPQEIPFDRWVTKSNWAEFSPPDEDIEAGDTVALNWGTAHGKEGETSERVVDLVTNHPTLRTLHAWVHAENPDGVFEPVNPEFGGSDHGH